MDYFSCLIVTMGLSSTVRPQFIHNVTDVRTDRHCMHGNGELTSILIRKFDVWIINNCLVCRSAVDAENHTALFMAAMHCYICFYPRRFRATLAMLLCFH